MRFRVKLPKLGDTVEQVMVLKWTVSVGDAVQEGDPLMIVETDKVDTDVPSPVAGVLVEQLVHEQDDVVVGFPIAVIEAT